MNRELDVLTTLVSARTSTAVAASRASNRSLGFDVTLGGSGIGLVNGLDGDNGLLLAIVVVACKGATRSVRGQLGYAAQCDECFAPEEVVPR